MSKKIRIPRWQMCASIPREEMGPLERFVFDWEPEEMDDEKKFRRDLEGVLIWVANMESPNKDKSVKLKRYRGKGKEKGK